MKTTFTAFILFLSLSFTKSQAQATLTAQEILAKNIAATGGMDYLKSIQTLYSNIATEMSGRKVNWITKEMLPNKGAFSIIYQGRTVFQNFYDGEKGYEMGEGKKKLADQAEFSDKKYRKNIFNELDYLDPSLYQLEAMGSEKVENQDCYKIKATCVNGATSILYYSKDSFLQLREDKATTEKGNFDTTYFYGYKKYGQLTYYSSLVFGSGDKMQKATLVELLVNEKVSDSDFK